MATEISGPSAPLPTDAATGQIRPLSKLLGSRELGGHRAMVAIELEVMAKKMDRFGWERDRGTAAHDRVVSDWMDALHDYPLGEVQAACRRWVRANSRRMPNEGDILGLIGAARREKIAAFKASQPKPPEPTTERVSADRAAEIMAQVGFAPKRMGAAE